VHRAIRPFVVFTLCAAAGGLLRAGAQAAPGTTRLITPSVFAGGTGVGTGLNSGGNFSVTAGVDVAFLPKSFVQPAIEYRGMYALGKGQVDSLKDNLGGVKVAKTYGRFRPYADLLAGRGETTYGDGGYQVPGRLVFYTQSSSNVFSLGGGSDVFATEHLGLKVDFQLQRYSSPVAASGHVYSETGTVGVVYVFHLGHGPV
jgi:hypothetical protein